MREQLAALHEASFGWALACCGRDRELAADVLQDAYFKVLDGRAKYAGSSAFKTWLFGALNSVETPIYMFNILDMIYGDHTYPHYGRYLQVEANRLLEFTWVSQGTLGKESIVRVDFEAVAGGTRVTLTHRGLPDEKTRSEHEAGWTEILQWLEERIDS